MSTKYYAVMIKCIGKTKSKSNDNNKHHYFSICQDGHMNKWNIKTMANDGLMD